MLDLVLEFVLANQAVTCPISGIKSPEQARLNVVAADQELDANTLRKIDEICPRDLKRSFKGYADAGFRCECPDSLERRFLARILGRTLGPVAARDKKEGSSR